MLEIESRIVSSIFSAKKKLSKLKVEFDNLSRTLSKKQSELKHLEEDYSNVLQLSLELMDLLQSSLKGEPVSIGKDIMTRMAENLNSRPASAAIGTLFKIKFFDQLTPRGNIFLFCVGYVLI